MNKLSEILSGTGVALATPFKEDVSQIDWEGLERLLAHAGPHVDYLVVNGTTAESPTVTHREKKQVLEFVKSHNPHHKPIVMGMGGNSTLELLEFEKSHNLKGVEALLSVCPYYNKPNQEGLYQHFKTLADHYSRPVILYNVPGRTSSELSAATTLRLASHPNIIGTKEASGNLLQCMEIARNKPEDFLLLSGDDLFALPMASLGGKGVISVIANAYPELYSHSVRNAINGDFETARRQTLQLVEITQAIFKEGNPTGIKQLLEIMGICQHHLRLPLVPASAALKEELALLALQLEKVRV